VLGRLGGDEFIASLPGLDRGAASRVAEALVEAFREPFQVSGKRINATVSVGVAVAPHDAGIADELVRHADAAMYEAKRRGGDCRDVYRGELDRHHSRRREVRERLRHALVAGELEMHYQPRIQLRSGRLVGIEALMRWESPELGRVSPAEFVPIAEETGLIDRLGSFAIEQACHDLRRLDQAGLTDLRVSVNVSGAQLMEQGYGSKLFSAIQAAEAEPSRIELEVTESVALYGLQDVAGLLREVRNAGLYVSLDDFGTGYSSLSVLLDLPLDCLKLDQSLVRDLHMNPDAASVVRAMILLAHSLGLTVVAEGVTEEAQEQLLRELDCDEVQGFRFAPALPLPKLIEFASQGKSR
jgi:predicted signal transduction protein with EAL and GGDEF domain